MPELPEVETIVRMLGPALEGRRILGAEFLGARVTRGSSVTRAEAVAGRTILGVGRLGKNIVLTLDWGVVVIHLGMTGKLLVDGATGPYTRAVFHLDGGSLVYDDVRQFGRIEWCAELPARLAKLGPEPLAVSFEDFFQRLHAKRGAVKAALLNQGFVRGMGNIYTDEALYRAGINPKTEAGRIGQVRALRLYEAMREVLMLAIAHRGSSVSDYVDACGEKGDFQQLHFVYGRAGKACKKCGSAIKRIVVAQRGTHYCPRCQKA